MGRRELHVRTIEAGHSAQLVHQQRAGESGLSAPLSHQNHGQGGSGDVYAGTAIQGEASAFQERGHEAEGE